MMDFGMDFENKSDLLGNKIGNCIFYLEMPDDLFLKTMQKPVSYHAQVMAEVTDSGAGGKESVKNHLGNLMVAFAQACLVDTPHTAQARVNKQLSTIFSVDQSLAQNIVKALQTPPNLC